MEPDSRQYVENLQTRDFRERINKSVLNDINRANNFYTSKIEPVLRRRHQIYEADREYYKNRFRHTATQSDFVSFDFWSVVQWAIPLVMNSFFGNNEAVVIVGRNEEDVPRAEVLKALINFQLMTQNKGFMLLWDWFSDAFQYNLGAIKIWWERIEDWQTEKLEYVGMDRLLMLQQDQWCQIDYVEGPDFFGMFNVAYRIGRLKSNKPKIESVRVTDLRWSPEARNLDEANFVAHRQIVTADHLRRQAKQGIYDVEAVERAIENTNGSGVVYNQFETELNDETDQLPNDEDTARSLFELYECYVKLDINGDGLLEDALVSVVGEELIRVTENPFGRVPIFTVSPVRDPFKVMADISLNEIVGEVQTIKTALMRQLLINTVNLNNIRWFINPNGVDLKDIQENKQFIKTKTNDPRASVMPFPQTSLAPWTMNLFEYLEGALEQWTGRTRYNQGTDSKSLNKTATGINLLQQASAQRIDYIVRVFAETGVGEALRFMVELNQKYIDQPQVIRLENTMLQVSPDDLKGEFDIDVNTEIGVGKRQQTIENLQLYLGNLALAGMNIGAITPGEWAHAAQKLLQEMGIRDPQSYVLDPEIVKQQFFMQMQQQMMAQQEQAQLQQAQLARQNQIQDQQLAMQQAQAQQQMQLRNQEMQMKQQDHAADLLERAVNAQRAGAI
ncbi:MAG: hypothetical protein IJR35_11655 [Synergistaceae bacterium]|nr:hypothetical protein [Synergistaceae bacterium]